MTRIKNDRGSTAIEPMSETTYDVFDCTPFNRESNPVAKVLQGLKKAFRNGKFSRAAFSRLDRHTQHHGKFVFTGPAPAAKALATLCADGTWSLHVLCPFCGETHNHGGLNGFNPMGGHRLSHCMFADTPGYWLEIEEGTDHA